MMAYRGDVMLSLGIIGCGRVTTMFHLNAISKVEGIKVVAVADPDSDRMNDVKKKSGAERGYLDYRDLLSDVDIEAVAVNTPPSLHEEMIIDSLRACKHVLCEKPIARSLEEYNRIKQVMKDTGLYVIPVHNYSLTPNLLKAKEIIKSGELGNVRQVALRFDNNLWSYRSKTEFRVEEIYGVVEDLVPHVLSVVLVLSDQKLELIDVKAWKRRYPVYDNLSFTLGDTDGVMFDCTMNWTSLIPGFGLEIVGDRGVITMDLMKFPYRVNIKSETRSTVIDKKGLGKYLEVVKFEHPAFRKQYEHFMDIVEGRIDPTFTIEDEIQMLRIMDEVTLKLTEHD